MRQREIEGLSRNSVPSGPRFPSPLLKHPGWSRGEYRSRSLEMGEPENPPHGSSERVAENSSCMWGKRKFDHDRARAHFCLAMCTKSRRISLTAGKGRKPALQVEKAPIPKRASPRRIKRSSLQVAETRKLHLVYVKAGVTYCLACVLGELKVLPLWVDIVKKICPEVAGLCLADGSPRE
ncbi:hypothetical protein NDU88_005662 [Pleurodeles waltl]|uniref:Uncharacterized protein n=1 Tax=Pleurodeles waltl TaxID=8319 RepID=A0AAV7TDA8_PLEWA|nr:hypothetical protein NDU88_005662 [Pleurodeles waltl]